MEETKMLNFLGSTAQGIAVANGVTTLALLEHLVERKILTNEDVRSILSSGIKCLEPRINVRTVAEAVHLMRDQMQLFTEGSPKCVFKESAVKAEQVQPRAGR
jgi:hypothetical protein